MSTLMNIVNFLVNNFQVILNGIIGVVAGLAAIALVIPGPQPEQTLQAIVNFLTKFSKK